MSTAVAVTHQQVGGIVAALRTSQELVARSKEIERVVAEVMKINVHFGTIPGTPKPTLYKAGAEVLCTAFSIAPDYEVEEISTNDEVSYRVKCTGTHQHSGAVLGAGMGECSSSEAKYKWRRPVCKAEFDEAPDDRRRNLWKRGRNDSSYIEPQVRTEPADMRNTVLQMACKRAFVSMTRSVTGAGSLFLQDLEDMPEEIREQLIEAKSDRSSPAPDTARTAPARSAPKSKEGATGAVTDTQVKHLLAKMQDAGMSAEQLCERFGIKAVTELQFSDLNTALAFVKDPERDAIQSQDAGK